MLRRTCSTLIALLAAVILGTAAAPAALAAAPAADAPAVQPAQVRPDLNGLRVKGVNSPAVYLILDGKRRHIPNPATYNNLFRDWNGIQSVLDVNAVDDGGPLSDGAILGKSPSGPEVYLISNGIKRWITSPAAMDKYYFAWNKIVTISPVALYSIPTGPSIS
ncbi:hypothetical protein ACFPM3_19585 [Streptomyces coeruleoprunus]|uniref:Uncharacterized protein n=1 Tax=Streptomyces coeruleoprunus TaxID=285563 RepID=A0ABV9XI66_9ACTN